MGFSYSLIGHRFECKVIFNGGGGRVSTSPFDLLPVGKKLSIDFQKMSPAGYLRIDAFSTEGNSNHWKQS